MTLGGAAFLMLPLIALAAAERAFGSPRLWLHAGLSAAFVAWAIYDSVFTYHYPHGPNTLFLIFPGLVALGAFYAFVFPMFAREPSPVFRRFRVVVVVVCAATFGVLSCT